MGLISETKEGVCFSIRVVPRASRSEYAGVQDEAFKFRITAPPVDGKANEECVKVVARTLGVKKAQVQITGGHTARTKRIAVSGITKRDVEAAFSRP